MVGNVVQNRLGCKQLARVYLLGMICLMIIQCLSECPVRLTAEGNIDNPTQIIEDETNLVKCLHLSLQKDWQSLTKSLVQKHLPSHKQKIIMVYQQQLNRLQAIEQEIVLGESSCEPILKWGQNTTHIFLSMKMSHRWDSPPCLNTKLQTVQLKDNVFKYSNLCLVSHRRINFTLSLQLYAEVLHDNTRRKLLVIKDGVGVYSVIFEKKQVQVWPFLDQQQSAYQLWMEIMERNETLYKEYQLVNRRAVLERKAKMYENNADTFGNSSQV